MLEKEYEDASYILEDIWVHMDWDRMNASRKRWITDEFTAKVRAYSRCSSSLAQVITRLCKSFNSYLENNTSIESMQEEEKIMNILREETQIPILLMTIRREEKKQEYKKKQEEKQTTLIS